MLGSLSTSIVWPVKLCQVKKAHLQGLSGLVIRWWLRHPRIQEENQFPISHPLFSFNSYPSIHPSTHLQARQYAHPPCVISVLKEFGPKSRQFDRNFHLFEFSAIHPSWVLIFRFHLLSSVLVWLCHLSILNPKSNFILHLPFSHLIVFCLYLSNFASTRATLTESPKRATCNLLHHQFPLLHHRRFFSPLIRGTEISRFYRVCTIPIFLHQRVL